MMTKADKRFIEYWREQREGSRLEYYLTYSVAWSIVIFLSLFFLLKLIMTQRDMGGWLSFFIILPVAIISAIVTTHLYYTHNEKRYNRLQ